MGWKASFLIVSTGDRRASLETLLRSMDEFYPAWNRYAVLQGYTEKISGTFTDVLHIPERIGPFWARAAGLSRWIHCSDVWCNLDDDMEFLEQTHFGKPMMKLADSQVGLVSCNWVKSASWLKRAAYRDEFIRQPIVFTGGGLLYRQAVGYHILKGPYLPYLFDNIEWSLRTYTAGYDNYRYLGSITLHHAVSKGGRRGWVSLGNRVLNNPDLIHLVPYRGLDNNYHIPSSANLTAQAHRLHKENYATLKR